jgi:hypothetical protein
VVDVPHLMIETDVLDVIAEIMDNDEYDNVVLMMLVVVYHTVQIEPVYYIIHH